MIIWKAKTVAPNTIANGPRRRRAQSAHGPAPKLQHAAMDAATSYRSNAARRHPPPRPRITAAVISDGPPPVVVRACSAADVGSPSPALAAESANRLEGRVAGAGPEQHRLRGQEVAT